MSGDQIASSIFVALLLLLVLSGLVARRVPGSAYLSMAGLWVLVIVVVTAAIWLIYGR
ncbi:hypothetical protein [Sphingomonas montanisoli]|uniref:hypothetical protein n=1 Tax=Sphingomonas montanisoli TaxID=2606412 RepID=UPI0015E16C9E|nr:hypothetical protein [Sphingomonas montanisoli]